ncbi:phosphatase PAP2 family protein [Bacillus gobiensis]|uniref:phosphatase PAP2 family protein n=1 Tax=Bacillus gobiensis TaxID=1441095 RepID=UPI003D1E2325
MNKTVYSLAVFLLMMAAVRLENVQAADDWLIHMFTLIRTPIFNQTFLFLTDFGASKHLLTIIAIVALFLILLKKIVPSLLLFLLYFTERVANEGIKLIVHRQRPHYHPLATETSFSFPSGHSMNTASVYLFIAFLLITYIPFFYRHKRSTWFFAFSLVFLIGISRIYIGVHFLTDVIAGWSLGYCFYLLFKKIDERMLAIRQN